MAPQNKLANTHVFIPLQHIPNDTTRSHFGDNRAATEDHMMVEHAKLAQESGLIDEETAVQISQPWHKTGGLRMRWKLEYLQMHPDYASGEKDGTVTLEAAKKKQRKTDAVNKRFIENWRAGRVDEHGMKIVQEGDEKGQEDVTETFDEGSDKLEETCSEETGNTHSQDQQTSSTRGAIRPSYKQADIDKESASSSLWTSHPTPNLFSQVYIFTPPQTSSYPAHLAPAGSLPPGLSPRPRVRKPKTATPPPLQPLPDHPTYASFVYGEVAALCRERDLPGGGVTQELRNRLIQDDTNVATGLPREKKGYKGNKRAYKYSAPVVGVGRGNASENGNQEGIRGDDEDQDEDLSDIERLEK